MIAPMTKPVICEHLTWKDADNADKLTKKMKMAIISTAACKQPGRHLPLGVNTTDGSGVAKRVSKRTVVPKTIHKIVDPIATIVVKFLIVIVFIQKKSGGGGERTK